MDFTNRTRLKTPICYFRLLTNGISKTQEELRAAIALHFAYYSFLPYPSVDKNNARGGCGRFKELG